MIDSPRTEPTAELRQLATTLWQAYVALTDAGFNEGQALVIIAEMLKQAHE